MTTHRQLAYLTFAGLFACQIKSDHKSAAVPAYVPQAPTAPFTPAATAPVTRTVRILHTNDEHSHLLGFQPTGEYPFLPNSVGAVDPVAIATAIGSGEDSQTVGGLVRRQYLINKLRTASPDPVLVLESGDVSMGTIFHLAEPTAAPDFLSLAFLGYDFMTFGNHEFDFGPDVLAESITTAISGSLGGAVPIVSTNIHFGDVVTHADGQPLNPGEALRGLSGAAGSGAPIVPYAVKTLANGLKVGFIGLLGYDAALVAPAKAPIEFSVPTSGAACSATAACTAGLSCELGHCVNPLDAAGHVAATAADAQPIIDILRTTEKVDLVVAMTHLGTAEDEALASMTTGLDVIIGGHSHEEIPPTKVGTTVIVQAGSYGRFVGELVVTVAPDGTVGYDAAQSTLHPVDFSLDAQIYAGTDLTTTPPTLSPAFKTALTLTGGLIAPVLAGLNVEIGQLTAGLGLPAMTAFSPVVSSDHTIVGEISEADSNLAQLVTDADRFVIGAGVCRPGFDTSPIVAVQANGVIRESLYFGTPELNSKPATTFADVFQVLPLGASPYETVVATPGYPMLMFHLTMVEMFAGLDVGVTQGLESDSFFLTTSGARVTYDRTLPPFDVTHPTTTGRITKLDLIDGLGDYSWHLFDRTRTPAWENALGNPINPSTTLVTIFTNLYLGGFLNAFGLVPLDATGTPVELSSTVLCPTGTPVADCGAATPLPQFAPCTNGGPEVKEWEVLLAYLLGLEQAGGIASNQYAGATPAVPRVVDATAP